MIKEDFMMIQITVYWADNLIASQFDNVKEFRIFESKLFIQTNDNRQYGVSMYNVKYFVVEEQK
jgi:hypothetical protein